MKKLLAGLIGGVALGMLFAPEKGTEMRKKISESDDKLKDFGREMLSAGKEASTEVQKFLESDDAQEFFAKGKEGVSELLKSGKDLSQKGKEELELLFGEAKNSLLEKFEEKFGSESEDQQSTKISGKKDDVLAEIKNFFGGEKK